MARSSWKPEDGLEAGLEMLDGPAELAVDRVPTVMDETPVATYRDWNPADTRVIRCRISNDLYPGERYESRDEARAGTIIKYGPILEANYVPGQAFFRVMRTPAKVVE